jgi:hypothetical protein
MHLSKVNNALDHRIAGGSEYQWTCWDNARFLDYRSDYADASVVFNTETQEVYVAEISFSNDTGRVYRWLNPLFKDAYLNECKQKNVDFNVAYDDVKYTDLDVDEDWLEKANAIMNNKPFDDRIQVPLDLDDDLLLELCLQAHKNDITLNKMVEKILKQMMIAEHNA